MLKNKKIIIIDCLWILLILMYCFSTISCVSPGAAKLEARVGVVEDNFNQLESVVDNNIEKVDTLKQQLFEVSKTVNNSGIIKYSGAGYVVLGTSVMAIIFLLAIFLFVKYFLKSNRHDSMLNLITKVISNLDPETQTKVKNAIETETSNGGIFTLKHKIMLADFTKANNTFIKKN